MVSYRGDWFFECADAYFRLQDDGAIEDDGSSPPRLILPVSDERRALHKHLLETRLATCDDCGERSLTIGYGPLDRHRCPPPTLPEQPTPDPTAAAQVATDVGGEGGGVSE